jgi:SAM-dependent methyltransferase
LHRQADAARYTGERPGWGRTGFDYDEARHLAAYHYAAGCVRDRDVLDAGCGEGFGTQMLAATARSVLGVDHSSNAIEACRRMWKQPNLRFQLLDLRRLGRLDETFDVVLNFQVLEHIADEPAFLEALRAKVKPDGRLLLTTPNRLKSFSENPFHLREYAPDELMKLLRSAFGKVTLLGIHGNDKVRAFDIGREKAVKRILKLDPLNLRKRLPRWLILPAFTALSAVVRRRARSQSGAALIEPEDFRVTGENPDEALDLLALCEP